ncbi:MAG: hypothetical protein HC916_12950 [Coleofasciculaceae cyanobacterium SM2_1_6]|nr:hypothetical protein [Coleofasciculaceae cyanobacterium SM2_1_6]
MMNLEKISLAIALTGIITIHTGFWNSFNASARADTFTQDLTLDKISLEIKELLKIPKDSPETSAQTPPQAIAKAPQNPSNNISSGKLNKHLSNFPESNNLTNSPNSANLAKQNSSTELPDSIAQNIFTKLSSETGLPQSDFVVTGATQATWADGCLGLGAGKICTQALVPGWRVVVAKTPVGNNQEGSRSPQTWTYRTNSTGSLLVLETSN